jgi:hypothetical protein
VDKQTESRSAFEAEFRQRHSFVPEASMAMMLEQYNFGTDEEPDWGYYSLAARDAWEWWQKSRESLVVELPEKHFDDGSDKQVCILAGQFNSGIDKCAESLRAIGIRIKGEGDES